MKRNMSDCERSLNSECPARRFDPLASGMEIVISGIAGRFPESHNVKHLQENLFKKLDLITDSDERWGVDHPDIPARTGKVHNINKFDANFFGVHNIQAHTMDPMSRMLLEHTFEAIVDAGINPKQLRETNTGVFIGACVSESEQMWNYTDKQVNGLGITGCSKAMFANMISYYLGVHGPSYSIDSACSSSLLALQHAYRAMFDGRCDSAIVAGSSLCLQPGVSLHFSRLGVLSPHGRSRTFDADADGYARSEAIAVVFLQRAKDAKRIYATVLHAQTNCDGFKEEGITYPSALHQMTLLKDFYLECGIDPNTINYIEAHGTGTKVGDPEEVNAIDKALCQNRKQPLKIGSIKSNLGHSEGASGVCSIAKVLSAMETGIIPPNIHYEHPRKELDAIVNGRLQVISEPTPWEGGLAAINSFGFGGTNVHVLLNHNPKVKINNGAPKDDLPRLMVVSGRTLEGVASLLNDVESRPVDVEYVRLLHNIYSENIRGYLFRGYSIIGRQTAKEPLREITDYSETTRPIWFVFSGMRTEWPDMGRALMRFPIFDKAMQKLTTILKPKGIDIVDVITNKNKDAFDNILNAVVGIAAIQIGLVDLLHALGIVPDNIIGYSVGELGCAYADGCLTAEQVILSAYLQGMALLESKAIFGSMAVVGLGYQDLQAIVPPDVDVAYHDSATTSTISGPAESVATFISELRTKNILATEVDCGNIPYHSRYIKSAGSKVLASLKQVIPKPKPRSEKWISSSVPQTQWSTSAAKYSSAEYHMNNLRNSVLFEEVLKFIPNNAITIEIAPDGLLQGILQRTLSPTVTNIALTRREHADNAEIFLQAIGRLYNVGHHPQVANIYPEVSFPVSRGTPMIAPLIKWDHSGDWYVSKYKPADKLATGERTVEVSLKREAFELMWGHIIDGRNLLPATGYLFIVWETLAMMKGVFTGELSVTFENVALHRATVIPKDGTLQLKVMIQKGSGQFEITDDSTLVASGYVYTSTDAVDDRLKTLPSHVDEDESLTTKDIYKEFRLRGYQYAGLFRTLKSVSPNGTNGKIIWNSNWTSFMDTMIQMMILRVDTRCLLVPTGIRKVVIDVREHTRIIKNIEGDEKLIPVRVYKAINVVVAGGVEIHGLNAVTIARRKPTSDPVLEKYEFVANRDRKDMTLQEAVRLCIHIALENQPSIKVKTVELSDCNSKVSADDVVSPIIMQVLGDLPLIQPDVSLFIDPKCLEEGAISSSVNVMETKMLPNDGGAMMAIGYGLLSENKSVVARQLLSAVKNDGFLLTRDLVTQSDNIGYLEKQGMHVIVEKRVGEELIVLARKKKIIAIKTVVVRVRNEEFEWIEQLKNTLNAWTEGQSQEPMRLILVGEQDPESGILGLVNCLRREPGGEVIRGVFIQDMNSPPFSLDNPLYHDQLETDLAINVLNVGNVWGSYRHMLLPPLEEKRTYHGEIKQMVRGDLSSLRMLQGPLLPGVTDDARIYITYSALNFRDIMIATAKIPVPINELHRKDHDGYIGYELCGFSANGQRYMGLTGRTFSNFCVLDPYLRWLVPDNWTMEDAVTVPMVYATCYYALYLAGDMRKGEKILIHAGSGGIGQAAINLALHEGCEIFTTVGTPEKRKFIRETFPSIPDDHIGNSRDTSFKEMIMTVTKGRGVDIVLNSLAEEKLQASVRCLSRRGRFLEIGKFDLTSNNELDMMCFMKNIKYKGVMLDQQFWKQVGVKDKLQELVIRGLNSGAVKPLTRSVFPIEKIEDACRYMAAGKHVGKVIIKIREEKDGPANVPMMALPRFYCDERKCYVIVGGLGGFGVELADWLILHEAKNIVLTSRTGVKNGYQRMRIGIWESYGVKVLVIAGKDASDRKDCEYILRAAEELAPVDGIFNLAVVLKDNLFTNQTVDTFKESFRCKAWATKRLDEVSRTLCRELKHFVVFSSVSCGRGNPGQTNYGMANSVMERICEKRVQDGLPGLAIQWGAVGDVGLVADMQDDDKELVIGGTLQQKINSCLAELDGFLMQDQPVVASMVVAEKRASAMGANNLVDAVLNIMGLKDIKLISHEVSLTELGMDSMMAVEIKQTLLREFEVDLSAKDIRTLNFGKLIALATHDEKESKNQNTDKLGTVDGIDGLNLLVQYLEIDVTNIKVCLQLATNPVGGKPELFIVPGLEGFGSIFNKLAPSLKCPAICFQLGIREDCNSSIETMARYILPYALDRLKNRKDFTVVGYSFGSLVAIELVRKLEADGMSGRLILIDGAPMQMKTIMDLQIPSTTDDELEDSLVVFFMDNIDPEAVADVRLDLPKCTSWEQKIELIISRIPSTMITTSLNYQRQFFSSVVQRLKALKLYSTSTLQPIKTPITLLKPTAASVQDVDEDYGLQKVTDGRVEIHYVEGNHHTMLNSYKVAAAMNGEELENAEEPEAR